jgi:hypothetical protein
MPRYQDAKEKSRYKKQISVKVQIPITAMQAGLDIDAFLASWYPDAYLLLVFSFL